MEGELMTIIIGHLSYGEFSNKELKKSNGVKLFS